MADLNTVLVKDAIAKGYNPKVYIIDYEMTHVTDSNYKAALPADFAANNLKIVEENAKGRTAGIKIVGPGYRNFYRIAAFDSDAVESRTIQTNEISGISPGVSLKKALNRISYSGTPVEFANYLLDFTDIDDDSKSYLLVEGVKSIGELDTKVPVKATITTSLGEVHVVKPVSEWTDDDHAASKIWMIYDDG